MEFCLGFLCGIFVALLVLGSVTCSHKNYRERAAMMESNSEISFKVPLSIPFWKPLMPKLILCKVHLYLYKKKIYCKTKQFPFFGKSLSFESCA